MAVNRVDFDGRTLIDLIGTTATADKILSGFGAFGRDGEWMDGTFGFEEGIYEPSSNIAHPTIEFAQEHDTPPSIAAIVDMTGTSSTTTQSAWAFVIFNWYRAWGETISYASNSNAYGYYYLTYRGNSTSSLSAAGTRIQYPDTNSSASGTSYMSYFLTKSSFKPYSGSSSRYFRTGRTYKWFALWI